MKKFCWVLVAIAVLLVDASFAAVTVLWQISDTTYATSEHGDSYWADTYYGEVSVRGADRFIGSDGRNRYVRWVKITYDVQGKMSSAISYSRGKFDEVQRKEQITVKDVWNNGPVTKVYYDFSSAVADGHIAGYSNDGSETSLYYDEDEIISGGMMIINRGR